MKAMGYADKVRDSLMIWGSPGIGKSAIARQYANKMYPLRKDNQGTLHLMQQVIDATTDASEKATLIREKAEFEAKLIDQDSNFVDFRLSQVEPTDLRGIPVPEKVYRDMNGNILPESDLAQTEKYIAETAVVWAAPKVLKLPADWKGVIMFDELNSAIPIVQAASYQLILDRCVGEMKLPDTALVLAAGNRDTDGGVTFQLATPLRDRMTHVEMIPHHQDWIDDYAITNRLNAGTVSFINNTGSKYFNTLKPNDPSHAGGSSPRSWEVVSKYEDMKKSGNMDKEVFRAMIAGRVTDAIAIEYIEFIDHVASLPETMEILNGNIQTIDKSLDISANYFISLNLVYKIIDLYEQKMKGELEVEQWSKLATNFINFMLKNFAETSGELSILAMRTISKANVKITYAEVPAFKPFVDKYQGLIRKARDLG